MAKGLICRKSYVCAMRTPRPPSSRMATGSEGSWPIFRWKHGRYPGACWSKDRYSREVHQPLFFPRFNWGEGLHASLLQTASGHELFSHRRAWSTFFAARSRRRTFS